MFVSGLQSSSWTRLIFSAEVFVLAILMVIFLTKLCNVARKTIFSENMLMSNSWIIVLVFTFLHAAVFEMCVAVMIIYRNDASLAEERPKQGAYAESIFLIAENLFWAVNNLVVLSALFRQAKYSNHMYDDIEERDDIRARRMA